LIAAAKLYQHAMVLAPRNAEVLNSFGEFLEESRQDLLQADHFFARAIGMVRDIARGRDRDDRKDAWGVMLYLYRPFKCVRCFSRNY
jgi:hypothetical protein